MPFGSLQRLNGISFFDMRKELATQEGERKRFRAVFSRLGKKTNFKGYSEETILLSNVVDAGTNKLVTDHVWFSYSKAFEKIDLTKGCMLEFDARVKAYKKGYVNTRYRMNNRSLDFKLSHPTKIRRIEV
ncbi:MAG: hypothetical protein KF725_06185 [Cyclobacteriaceae bacterium]|nr:hypothetical protein [Cyclobacteriaceae bacterium]UYN85158.1 MAG: hypothetical protein KIT51_09625 [Cyclobacteriaceae bacterium]